MACTNLLFQYKREPLNQIITENKKWILYKNIIRKKHWIEENKVAQLTLKLEHLRKVLLIFF